MVKRMRSFFAVVMLVIAATVNAQVTTSSMSGKVVWSIKAMKPLSARRFRLFMSRPAPIMGLLPMWTAVIPSRVCVPAALTK